LLNREQPEPGRRELYGERYALQSRAYPRHDRGVLRDDFEARMPTCGTISEQTCRIVGLELLDTERLVRHRHREGAHEPTELAPYAQWFPRQTKEAILASPWVYIWLYESSVEFVKLA